MKYAIRKIIVLAFLSILLYAPCLVFAADNNASALLEQVATDGGYADVDEYSMSKIIGTVISTMFSLLGVVFVSLMIYGGFKWMKSSGREEDVKTAQVVIRNAIIGLILTVSSYTIMIFIFNALT